jgi:hypothetical protein
VAKTTRGLYRVSHDGDEAFGVEVMSVMELHRRMGYIAPASARKLVEDGHVTGLALDPDSSEKHCDACIYARATRQSIPKVSVSEQAQNF